MFRTRSGSFATADSQAAQRSNDPAQRKARHKSRSGGYSVARGKSRRPRLRAPAREAARRPPSPQVPRARRLHGRLPAEASSQRSVAIALASIAPPRPREVPSCHDPTARRYRTRGSVRHQAGGRLLGQHVFYRCKNRSRSAHVGPEAASPFDRLRGSCPPPTRALSCAGSSVGRAIPFAISVTTVVRLICHDRDGDAIVNPAADQQATQSARASNRPTYTTARPGRERS